MTNHKKPLRDRNEILLDRPNRRLELLVSPEELAARSAKWRQRQSPPKYSRGYYRIDG